MKEEKKAYRAIIRGTTLPIIIIATDWEEAQKLADAVDADIEKELIDYHFRNRLT